MVRAVLGVLVGVVVAVAALAVTGIEAPPRSGATTPSFNILNESAALGAVYHPGVILGAASNATTTMLGGIGVYTKVPELTLPGLAALSGAKAHIAVANLTPIVNSYFWDGGVYGMGWNGSAWLIGGQAGWGGGNHNFGSLVSIQGGRFTNRTALLGSAFDGGGVFAMGWNGSAWLLGGNASWGPTLISLQGNRVTNLSSQIHGGDPRNYLQLILWNGQEWIVGGEGVFGLLTGTKFTDLWTSAPYQGSGVYAAAWNGSAWLVGGGAAQLVVVQGDSVRPAPPLAGTFDQSVTFIAKIPGGWLVGGTGMSDTGAFVSELAFWDGRGTNATTLDLTPSLPSAFVGGDLQSGCWAPEFGPTSILVVGEGQYDNDTGYGIGAVALVNFSDP